MGIFHHDYEIYQINVATQKNSLTQCRNQPCVTDSTALAPPLDVILRSQSHSSVMQDSYSLNGEIRRLDHCAMTMRYTN